MTPDNPAAEVTPEMRADHVMRWTFDDGSVTAEAVCKAAPGSDCRLEPKDHHECQCETWGRIERRPDGTIWHLLTDGYRDLTEPRSDDQWHEVVPANYCNIEMFINESGCAEELIPDGEHPEFVIGEVPFTPVWENDGCSWHALTASDLRAALGDADGGEGRG